MPKATVVRIGTRGSKLALAQARQVADDLLMCSTTLEVEIVEITTQGDKDQRGNLSGMGGTGVFVKELERALLDGKIDLAVHCMKDLPVGPTEGVSLAAVTKRLMPFDVLISREGTILDDLPSGAAVGTGSPRRMAQLLSYRPDLEVVDIRGNLDTRLKKLERGMYDAIVVAAAGVERLGLQDKVSEIFTTELCLPAPGQGALGIQVRSGDKEFAKIAKKLDDSDSRKQVSAERSFLRRLGAGCHVPAGALCTREGDAVLLEGLIASPDGVDMFRDVEEGAPGEEIKLGVRLAERLIDSGAATVLESLGVEC
jgi:hydroxymethylbilane synthase